MHLTSKSTPTDRLLRVLVATATVTLLAIAPALLASLFVHQDTVNQIEPSEPAATIDVTDIDQNGTVMYTIIPFADDSAPTDSSLSTPHALLKNSDLIKITIEDDEDPSKWLGDGAEDDCRFTLRLSDDDMFDNQSETFTGYIRVTDDYLDAQSEALESEKCGFYLSLDFEE